MSYIGNTPGVSSQRFVQRETVSGSAKSLFVVSSGYSLGYVDVFVNGAQLDESDFTATDGVTVTLGTAAAVGDIVRIIAWLPRGLSDGYLKSEADARYLQLTGGALTGALTSSGSFSTSSTNGYNVQLSGGNAYRMYATTNDLVFRSVTAGSDVMTLTYGGNVGIGTSSPSSKLDVQTPASTNGGATFGVNGSMVGTLGSGGFSVNGGAITDFGIRANANMLFSTGSGAPLRMTLDSSGNLGLGVTPSAGGSIYYKSFELGKAGCGLFAATNSLTVSELTYLAGNAVLTYSAGPLWTRGSNGPAAVYGLEDGNHKWFVGPDGTAGNAISFTQAMTLDASGRLSIGSTTNQTAATMLTLIGSSSSGSTLYVQGATNTLSGQIGGLITLRDQTAATGVAGLSGVAFTSGPGMDFRIGKYWSGSGSPRFVIGNAADALGSDFLSVDTSGNLLVGTTSQLAAGRICLAFSGSTNQGWVSNDTGGGSGSQHMRFLSAGTNVGNINTTTTATSYATSSDYRLKENIQPMTGALAKVAQLKPVTYKWKADGSDGEGFIAHELQAVVPQAVTGEKDAVDAEGKPQYQGIDTSFLVATLTAAIQELKAIVDAQAERIAVLENA